MVYANNLGEFVAPFEKDDWVNHVRWNERRPIVLRGALNPWELERTRYVWEQEKVTWPKIDALKKEYHTREQEMQKDISIFNSHLSELERIMKKKVGMGPIGQYSGMALAIIPGFGWFSAAFSAISMGIEMIGGNKKKKRIHELMRIMEEAQKRLRFNQERLLAIQGEVRLLMGVTGEAQQRVESKTQQDLARVQIAQQAYEADSQTKDLLKDQELRRVRQSTPKRVSYVQDL